METTELENLEKKKESLKLELLEVEKTLLEIKESQREKTILERIGGCDDALIYLGEEDEEVLTYRWMEKYQAPSHILSEQRCVLVCRALNEKKPLGSTTYTPYFDTTKKAGSGFYDGDDASRWSSGDYRTVCFRLHLNDRNHAIHAGKIMEQDYYNFIIK